MTPAQFAPRCTAAWCRQPAVPGETRCPMHLDAPGYRRVMELQRNDYRLACMSCGRGDEPRLTVDEARKMAPQKCPYCGSRVFLTPVPTMSGIGRKTEPPIPNATDIQLRPPRSGRADWPAAQQLKESA